MAGAFDATLRWRPIPTTPPSSPESARATTPLAQAPARFPTRHSLQTLSALVRADLRARYGRGPWRLAKWLLDPFALVGVYLLLVTFVLDRSGPAPGLSLACAVIPFQLLMLTVTNAMSVIDGRRSLIANMWFPRILLPVASALTESTAFAASLLLAAGMMVVYGIAPTIALLWLPLVLGATVALAAAVAYPASLAGFWVRDLRPFITSLVRALFFLAPGLIALDQIGGDVNELIRLNPLTGLFEAFRDVLLYGQAPAAWELLYPLAAAAVVAAVFLPIYAREQGHLAKVVE